MTALITESGYEIYKCKSEESKRSRWRVEVATHRVEDEVVRVAGRERPDNDCADEPVCSQNEVIIEKPKSLSFQVERDLRRPNPARGALKGRLLPHTLLKGRIPSRPSSWLTRPWEKI